MTNRSLAEKFIDVEIQISSGWEGDYPVKITLDGQSEYRGHLSAEIEAWSPRGDPEKDGKELFDLLLADASLRTAWGAARGKSQRRRIRLYIDPSATELHTIPWELLRDESVMLSAQADTPFSRYLPIALPWSGPIEDDPVRALVVISDPKDLASKYNLAPLDVELERQILETAFGSAGPDKLTVHFLPSPVTPGRLGEELHHGYHILHFLGHGAFNKRRSQAALYMQDQQGNAQRFLDSQLANMLVGQRAQPRLIFLGACQSATRSTADAFLGLGPKLVNRGIPAVVAMQGDVFVDTAREFSSTFYRRLLEHGYVDLAVNQARNTLAVAQRSDAAIPVLFMRLVNGTLFAPTPSESSRSMSEDELAKVNPIELRQAMIEAYDRSSLQMLTSELAILYEEQGVSDGYGVEYDSLRGEGVHMKIMYLIDWHRRRERMADLVRKVLADRPYLADRLNRAND